MKAVVYNGPRNVEIKEMPDPKIQHPSDVIVRITTTNICGSDLHMYEGRTDLEAGKIIGHENLGEILECGSAVASLQPGDRVCIPFNASCGYCKNCERGLTSACLTLNPGTAGAGYGYAGMGDLQGGQAEYLRVPYGDFNCLKLPEDAGGFTTSCAQNDTHDQTDVRCSKEHGSQARSSTGKSQPALTGWAVRRLGSSGPRRREHKLLKSKLPTLFDTV